MDLRRPRHDHAGSGYVSPLIAVVIGIASDAVRYFAVVLKNKLHWDDALVVWN